MPTRCTQIRDQRIDAPRQLDQCDALRIERSSSGCAGRDGPSGLPGSDYLRSSNSETGRRIKPSSERIGVRITHHDDGRRGRIRSGIEFGLVRRGHESSFCRRGIRVLRTGSGQSSPRPVLRVRNGSADIREGDSDRTGTDIRDCASVIDHEIHGGRCRIVEPAVFAGIRKVARRRRGRPALQAQVFGRILRDLNLSARVIVGVSSKRHSPGGWPASHVAALSPLGELSADLHGLPNDSRSPVVL